MITFRVQATSSGRVVSWERLKAGELADESWYSLSLTAALTDAITDTIVYCRQLDPSCTLRCLEPNTPPDKSLALEIVGRGFRVQCRRCLARGSGTLSPFSSEDGSAYDVTFTIEAENEDLEDEIAVEIQTTYPVVFSADE